MRVTELGHAAQLSFREYWSIMAYEVWADDAGGAYSGSTLEDPFEADLNVGPFLHCKIID